MFKIALITVMFLLLVGCGQGGSGGGVGAESHDDPITGTDPDEHFASRYDDLIPSDATIETYDPKRFSLITGVVQGLDGNPIPGVTVAIGADSRTRGHGAKYGSVKTDDEGHFTIPTEGGDTQTLSYNKAGLVSSHRQVYVPWNDTAVAETVRMIPEDSAATTLSFDGNQNTVISHQSTVVSDEFGSRSATLVFTGNNKAYEVGAEGNVIRELSSITARATEFTTPQSMPATLPPNSAYTYCVEMSVDGAARVRFDAPVTSWVDNFLGFEVGEAVPVGYYDRDRGVWVPSENGVVVLLLDTDSDGAVDALDSDGDGLANDLDGDGSFSDEVLGLGDPARYVPDSTFWRFSVTHFTPWDCNWPYGPPEDAASPNPESGPESDEQDEEVPLLCDGKSQISSFVEDRSRIFHEDIPIPGTDLTLHYASNRAGGYKSVIRVPASGPTVPESLNEIIVKVQVAGRSFEKRLPPEPDQVEEFLWDGLDHLGRPVAGSINARVSVGFSYGAVYYAAGDFRQAFGSAGSDITRIRARQEVVIWKRKDIAVQRGGGTLAEGWTLSAHHRLSQRDTGALLKGDGTIIRSSPATIETIAGNGGIGHSPDGSLATFFEAVWALTVDAAGDLYISEEDLGGHSTGYCKIRKIDSNGTIKTVAGNGILGYSGDGGPAVEASISSVRGMVVDATGNLYLADTYNHRIRKVDVNGIITTVAGNGIGGYSGDGGPAVDAQIAYPSDVALDVAGNLYIADSNNHRIRRVDTSGIIRSVTGHVNRMFSGDGGPAIEAGIGKPESVEIDQTGNLWILGSGQSLIRVVDASGIITTAAGNGVRGYGGDGGPATEAMIWPYDFSLDAVGNLYIVDTLHYRIRKVASDGVITTVAGNGAWGHSGDGGAPTEAMLLDPTSVAIDAAGSLYIVEKYGRWIRKLTPNSALGAANLNGEFFFAEENGQGHVLSIAGQHQKTIDLDTGATLRELSYDEDNNLTTITDRFGNVTRIDWTEGVPVAIVSPDGLTTRLSVDGENHLARVSYPDGSGYSFDYSGDGLMTAEADPKGNRFEHLFDYVGRLTDVTDGEGGHWSFEMEVASGGILVRKTTGEGEVTTYLEHTDSTGAYTSTVTGPSGGVSIFSRSADSLSATRSLPCGMEISSKYDRDPEYHFPFAREVTISTPAGLAESILRDRTYQDSDGDELPDLITETVTVNGRATTLETDTALAKKEVTSPSGRKVTAFYDPQTLLTSRLNVPGLYDLDYGYDDRGRLTFLGQDARRTTFTYNAQGFLDSVTDPENRTITYDHDAMGRVTGVLRPDNSLVSFTYDRNGNMTVLTNPSSVDHGFDYNGVDLKSGYQTPLSGSYSYLYDRDRRLTEIHFPSGRSIRNFYSQGRLDSIQTPEGNVDLSYLCATKLGSVSKGGESITYGYDGPLVISETSSGTIEQSLSFVYNNDFNLTGYGYAGDTENFTYDNDGLLTGAGRFTLSRNADNGLPEAVSDGSFVLDRSFNSYGEVEAEVTTVGVGTAYAYNLIRDRSGRITAKTETLRGVRVNYLYGYDAVGRLRTVTRDGTLVEEYRYDEPGGLPTYRRTYEMNTLRGIAGRILSYDDEDHLQTAGNTSYRFDLDGFLSSKIKGSETTRYTYSSRGELLSVNLPDGKSIEYIHDPQGRRVAKKVNGVIVEKYLWQGLTRLLAVYDGSDKLLMRFEYADDRVPVAMTKGSTTYYLAYDQVGSLRLVLDVSGNVVKNIEYDSFGNLLRDSNSALTVPFGFAGGVHDTDTWLVRFGYRDYDPGTGRWTAKDPIGFAGGDVDLYGYVWNSVTNYSDPSGENPYAIGAVIVLAGYGVKKAGDAWEQFIEEGFGLREQERKRADAWKNDDIDGVCDAQKGRARAAQKAGLAGAKVLKAVPGTTLSGPLPTDPTNYLTGLVTSPIVDSMFDSALEKDEK